MVDRTIQPTQVTGFNQFFDDVNGTEAWQYAAGLDARLTGNLSGGVEASKRDLSEPVQLTSRRIIREDRDETLYRTYLYWTLSPEWAVAGEFSLDLYDSDHGVGSNLPTEVETRSAPLSVRYFSPLGFFSVLTGTFVDQHVHRPDEESGGNDTFYLVDAAVGYRFPQRRGLVSLQVRNLFDTDVKFQDEELP